MDMAVGIIIGAAFGKIVSSFVDNVLMPPLGMLIGNTDFSRLAIELKPATAETAAVMLGYGQFIQTIMDFVIIAFAIFLGIRAMNRVSRKEEAKDAAAPPPPGNEEKLLAEIRDLLKERR
jgi:large conductance mechanosensitive channel